MSAPGQAVLVVAPHADDESIGCGGTLARLGGAGWTIHAVLVTAAPERANRLAEYRLAAGELGIAATEFLGYGEQQIPDDPALVRRLHGVLQRVRPGLVLVPHGAELDRDHRAANRLVRAALWMVHQCGGWPVPALWEYEIWSSMQRPDVLVDISAYVERKRAAILGYGSQMAIRDYASAALGLNAFRACMHGAGRGFCEAFTTPSLPGHPHLKSPCIHLA